MINYEEEEPDYFDALLSTFTMFANDFDAFLRTCICLCILRSTTQCVNDFDALCVDNLSGFTHNSLHRMIECAAI